VYFPVVYFRYIQTSSRQKLISIVDNRRHRRVYLNSIPLMNTIKLRTLSFVYATLCHVTFSSSSSVCIKLFLLRKTLDIVEEVTNIIFYAK